jgi:hypothetical protein
MTSAFAIHRLVRLLLSTVFLFGIFHPPLTAR